MSFLLQAVVKAVEEVANRDIEEGRKVLTRIWCIVANGPNERIVDFDRRSSINEFKNQI